MIHRSITVISTPEGDEQWMKISTNLFDVITLHLNKNGQRQSTQAMEALRHGDRPVILMGDANNWHEFQGCCIRTCYQYKSKGMGLTEVVMTNRRLRIVQMQTTFLPSTDHMCVEAFLNVRTNMKIGNRYIVRTIHRW